MKKLTTEEKEYIAANINALMGYMAIEDRYEPIVLLATKLVNFGSLLSKFIMDTPNFLFCSNEEQIERIMVCMAVFLSGYFTDEFKEVINIFKNGFDEEEIKKIKEKALKKGINVDEI